MSTPTELLQLTYAGIAIGAGSAYDVEEIEGLADLPGLRTSDQNVPGRHGATFGPDLLTSRTITLTLTVVGEDADDTAEKLDVLKAALSRPGVEDTLAYWLPGQDVRQLTVVCRRFAQPVDWNYLNDRPQVVVQLDAADPRAYSADLHISTQTGSSVTHSAPNAGNFESEAVVTLAGPYSGNVTITHQQTGAKIVMNSLSLSSGQTFTVDLAARTLKVGSSSVIGKRDHGASTWFALQPYGNTITVATSASATSTVKWRDAWV